MELTTDRETASAYMSELFAGLWQLAGGASLNPDQLREIGEAMADDIGIDYSFIKLMDPNTPARDFRFTRTQKLLNQITGDAA